MSKKETLRWKNKGDFYFNQKKDYWKAIVCYNKAIEVNPEYSDLWSFRGSAYFQIALTQKKKKFFKKAIKNFEKAIEIKSRNIDALLGLVSTYAALNNTEKMIEYFKRAEEVDSEHPQVKKLSKEIKEMEKLREETIKELEELKEKAEKS